MDECDLHWVAGFLEGEGSFFANKQNRGMVPTIKADNSDPECLERLRTLLGGSMQEQAPRSSRIGSSTAYQWRVVGLIAIQTMQDLRPLMSRKRQVQIDNCLDKCCVLTHAGGNDGDKASR